MSIPLDPTLAPVPEVRLEDPLPLLLLRDELAVDAAVASPDEAARVLPQLIGLVVGGFVAQALCTGILWSAFGGSPLLEGGHLAVRWAFALSGGYFLAICAGLPGYWFHTVVLGITPPAWRIALELVRVQAVGSVVLAAVLPLWVAACLGLWMLGGDLPDGVVLAGNALPMLCALPGLTGLTRSFTRMGRVRGVRYPVGAGRFLTLWWAGAFVCTAPVTAYRLLALL